MTPTLLVLAAGMSTRYGGTAKQTDAMGPAGETLLDYSVFDARRAGFGRAVFVIRREGEVGFRERVVARLERHLPVTLVHQEMHDLPDGLKPPENRTKPWGTGHAVLAARNAIQEPFAVINADDFYGRDSFRQMAAFLQTPGLSTRPCRGCMVGFVLRNTLSEHGRVARGLCSVNAQGYLERVEELTDIYKTPAGAENRPATLPVRSLTGGEIVSMNMWGFTAGIFAGLMDGFRTFLLEHGNSAATEYYIPLGIDRLIRSGAEKVQVLETASRWFGVTYQEDKPRVQQELADLVRSGAYPEPLW
ncbi:MAG: NTP transferase domain-containing protein [Verrucomicrobiales bacterium]|nr:NTP transferase domain-containing protein [Verrucomicrobiales bacterium]